MGHYGTLSICNMRFVLNSRMMLLPPQKYIVSLKGVVYKLTSITSATQPLHELYGYMLRNPKECHQGTERLKKIGARGRKCDSLESAHTSRRLATWSWAHLAHLVAQVSRESAQSAQVYAGLRMPPKRDCHELLQFEVRIKTQQTEDNSPTRVRALSSKTTGK